jgi:hypothetical protein
MSLDRSGYLGLGEDRGEVTVDPESKTKGVGGGGGSRTRVRKCYWSRDYMLIRVHALGITQRRSRPPLRTDKKRLSLA